MANFTKRTKFGCKNRKLSWKDRIVEIIQNTMSSFISWIWNFTYLEIRNSFITSFARFNFSTPALKSLIKPKKGSALLKGYVSLLSWKKKQLYHAFCPIQFFYSAFKSLSQRRRDQSLFHCSGYAKKLCCFIIVTGSVKRILSSGRKFPKLCLRGKRSQQAPAKL